MTPGTEACSMVIEPMRRAFFFASFGFVVAACTDTGLYAAGAGGPSGPDRSEIRGNVCVPMAAGEAFPVKVLFALPAGTEVDRAVVGGLANAVSNVTAQFATPYISFAMVGYNAIATGIQGSFVRDERVAQAPHAGQEHLERRHADGLSGHHRSHSLPRRAGHRRARHELRQPGVQRGHR